MYYFSNNLLYSFLLYSYKLSTLNSYIEFSDSLFERESSEFYVSTLFIYLSFFGTLTFLFNFISLLDDKPPASKRSY